MHVQISLCSSCFGVRECHWCEVEGKCVQNTECCNQDTGRECCGEGTQEERFEVFKFTCIAFAIQCFESKIIPRFIQCGLLYVTKIFCIVKHTCKNVKVVQGNGVQVYRHTSVCVMMSCWDVMKSCFLQLDFMI